MKNMIKLLLAAALLTIPVAGARACECGGKEKCKACCGEKCKDCTKECCKK
jgi:hypothetical protein